MAGFVVISPDSKWSINNVGWRAVFEPASQRLTPESSAHAAVTRATRGGIPYLDLSNAGSETTSEIAEAVRGVRDEHAANPSDWQAPFTLQAFLVSVDELLDALQAVAPELDG